jgi:hypothetical protein
MLKHSTNKKSTTRSPSPRVLVATILMGLFEVMLLRSWRASTAWLRLADNFYG